MTINHYLIFTFLSLLIISFSCNPKEQIYPEDHSDNNYNGINIESSLHFEEGYSILNRNGKKIFVDKKGNIPASLMHENIVKNVGAEISSLDHFHNGLAVVMFKKDGDKLRWGYINTKGENPFGKSFDYAGEFEDGKAIIKEGEKWGIINTKGNYEIKPNFDGISQIVNNHLWVREGASFRYISFPEMKQVLEGSYLIHGKDFEGTFWIEKPNSDPNVILRAYANNKGDIISPWYSNATDFSEGIAAFEENEKWGFIDKEGKIIIEPQFGYASDFSEGLAAFTDIIDNEFGKWGYIDIKGGIVIPQKFEIAANFINGYAKVKDKKGLTSFIDKSGNLIHDYQYELTYNYHENLAAVKIDSKWGFIDTEGQFIIQPKFDKVSTFIDEPFEGGFSGGIAKVGVDGYEFFIDREGNCVMGCLE